MTRFSYSVCAVLMAAALLLSCNKKIDSQSITTIKGLTITASQDGSSRTTFDGQKSKWSDGDKMNVLISASDDSSIGPNEFEITDAENAQFSNDEVVTNAGELYKFYAVYPVCDISADKRATIQVGAAAQAQDGASAGHIAALDPLYGYTESTPEAVSIPMKHTAVVMKLDIKNLTDNANLVIKQVKVKAPSGVMIAGPCSVDIEQGNVTPTSEAANSIVLSIDGAQSVSSGSTFTAWVAAAPFTIARGGSLLFTIVDAENNEYDVIKSFPDGRDFISGKILSATLEIKEKSSVETTITASFDFTDKSIYPADVATSTNTPDEKITCISEEGYSIDIYAAKGCYYTTANNQLKINEINTKSDDTQYATMSLPQIAGYKIVGIKLKNATGSSNASVMLCYKEGNELKACDDKLLQSQNVEFAANEIAASVNDDSQYYLKFVTVSKMKITLNSLEITYARL